MTSYPEYETKLIGAALTWPETLNMLDPDDFLGDAEKTLWRALRGYYRQHDAVEVDLVAAYLKKYTGADLTSHLEGFIQSAPVTLKNAACYAKNVREAARQRKMDDEISRLAEAELTVDDKIQSLNNLLKAVAPRSVRPQLSMQERLKGMVERMEAMMEKGGIPGISSGLPMFDAVTGGFQDSDLYILAARPSIGKTALAVNIALHVENPAFVSAEQPGDQIVQRMVGINGGINTLKLRNPRSMDDKDWAKLTASSKYLSNSKIQIFDDPAPTIEAVRYWSRGAVDRGAEIVIVDYLQIIKAADRSLSTFDRISYVAQSLKEMARELSVPVLSLAQINRQGSFNAKMEHLKGSGDIEQEADLVMILQRDLEKDQTRASLNIEKNRHGPITDIPLYFENSTMTFREATRRYETAEEIFN